MYACGLASLFQVGRGGGGMGKAFLATVGLLVGSLSRERAARDLVVGAPERHKSSLHSPWLKFCFTAGFGKLL